MSDKLTLSLAAGYHLRAKALCDGRVQLQNFTWNRLAWEEQGALMGADPWKFGIKQNQTVLRTIGRYAEEQGLLAKSVTLDDLFIRMDEAE